jgi:hypothetical protein
MLADLLEVQRLSRQRRAKKVFNEPTTGLCRDIEKLFALVEHFYAREKGDQQPSQRAN